MTQDNFQKQVLDRLDALSNDVKQISKDNEKFSDRFTNYQQATQSLISRAFSLIVSATIDLLGNKLKKPQKPIWIKVSRILSQKP